MRSRPRLRAFRRSRLIETECEWIGSVSRVVLGMWFGALPRQLGRYVLAWI